MDIGQVKKLFPIVAALLISLTNTSLLGQSRSPPAPQTWVNRPWEIRYFMFVRPDQVMDAEIAVAKEANAEADGGIYDRGLALLEKTVHVIVPGRVNVAAVIVRFDPAGKVTSPTNHEQALFGKRNLLNDIVLISADASRSRPYKLAMWSEGIPGDVDFSPAVCELWDLERYQDNWNKTSSIGNFGCREWTAQLYDQSRPYIDVTSYRPSGAHFGEFVGWSRFEDPPKPVIGKQGDTWVCLHECPDNEQPGVIPDIKKWAAKHNFPLPTRPDRQPLYPNSLFKDDLNEFAD